MFAMLIAMLSGCILSATPKDDPVVLQPGQAKTFTIKVFPSQTAIKWSLDETDIPGQTLTSYAYTPTGMNVGEHNLTVTEKSALGTYTHSWNIVVTQTSGYMYMPEIPGGFRANPLGINDAVEIVGNYYNARNYGFFYKNNIYTTIDVPGSYDYTIANDINNSGTIVGVYNKQEQKCDPYGNCYWVTVYYNFSATNSGGGWTYTTLPTRFGDYQTTATGINDNGVIVGYAQDVVSGGTTMGFVYDGSNFQLVEYPGPIEGWPVYTAINKINNNGVMVGTYYYAYSGTGGFIYDGSTFSLLPGNVEIPAADFSLNGINDLGHIVGSYQYDQLTYLGLFYDGTSYNGIVFHPSDINNHDVIVGQTNYGVPWILTP
jgi:hypothetical protein